jgi:hypothetical protein
MKADQKSETNDSMAFKPVKNIRDPPNQSAEVIVCGLLAVEYLLLPSL